MPELTLDDFNYTLPDELIAQEPASVRDGSRLLVCGNDTRIVPFHDILDFMDERDIVVINNSKVMKSRFIALCERTHKQHELLFVQKGDGNSWSVMAYNTKKLEEGDVLILTDDCRAILKKKCGNLNEVAIEGNNIMDVMEKFGTVPLPPYIKRPENNHDKKDEIRYQTVYSKTYGSCAAPTAGLHFTEKLMGSLKSRGVTFVEASLHVGPGTFLPVKTQRITEHKMHSEWIELEEGAVQILNRAIHDKKRINAVGTTSVRILESCFKNNAFSEYKGLTDIFIHPPMTVKSVQRLLTNFHQPRSTLLMLVSAFSGMEKIRKAYETAIHNRMRFFSYGDAMLLENSQSYIS